jgi:chromosome partitioning protein
LVPGRGMIVCLYSTKGGCGKTTLAAALAAFWSERKRTTLIDADPQASLRAWSDEARRVPVIFDTAETIGTTVAKLAKECDRLVIDTAGFRSRTNIEALAHSDFVLIPCKPSPLDVSAALEAVELVREVGGTRERKGRPLRCGIVLSMAQRTAVAAKIREELEGAGLPLLKAQIGQRTAFVEAPIAGYPPEASAAALEVKLLALEVERKAKG